MAEEKIIDIKESQQDEHNFNKGTSEGQQLMEESFADLGAGRSILIDKDGKIIAGNKSQKAAMAAGIKKVRVIETTGDELVAVKRTDISIDSEEGRRMAWLDNRAGQVNLSWDEVELPQFADMLGVDLKDLGMEVPTDDDVFEEKFKSLDNEQAVYPIIPKYDERHEIFVIVSDNEVDANYLREVLNMQKMASYKKGKLMKSNVVHIKDVINELKNRNSESQASGQSSVAETGA